MGYEVQIEHFEGPLDLLLHLIEKEEVDISQVSLADITDQFISYLDKIEEQKPDEIVDFLAVAARLMLIKSKALLPNLVWGEEDDNEAQSLEDQLRQYKRYIEAAREIDNRWRSKIGLASSTKLRIEYARSFYPPHEITSNRMQEAFTRMLERMKRETKYAAQTVKRSASIKVKIARIKDMLFNKIFVGFKTLIGEKENKTEIIVTFLALLELVKQKTITAEQHGNFEDIRISSNDNGSIGSPRQRV